MTGAVTTGDHRLAEVALGETAPDTVVSNGTVFNAHTGEFVRGQSIWIKGGRIAYVGPDHDPKKETTTQVLDVSGMVVLPGLIDGHTHVVFRCGIEEFVKWVIPGGTTTVITETIELATIAGVDGIEHLVRGLEDQPIRFYFTVPPLCGLTASQETGVPTNETLKPWLEHPSCLGVGEIYWGNLFLKGEQGERVRELSALALDLGKRVEGHSAGARGRKLQAYTCFGISSCHEPTTEDEVLERLRLGYWVMIRQGAIRKELEGVKGIFQRSVDHRRLILSTDGVDPEGLIEEGYLEASLKEALRLGAPPALAYQMVTLNVAEHFRLDHVLGSVAPGKLADMVIIPSAEDFSPQLVMCGGRVIFKDGRRWVQPKKVSFPDHLFHTVSVPDHTLPALPERGVVRVVELVTRLVTQEGFVDLDDGVTSAEVNFLLALDRLGSSKAFLGLFKGYGLRRGACGSTMCWDSGDMMVVGCDSQSMRTVVDRLRALGGGGVYAIGEEIVAELAAPVCGVISLEPMEELREKVRRVEASLRRNGVRWEKPLLTIETLTSAAIPHFRVTHDGYVRLKDRTVLPLEVSPVKR